MEKLLLKRKYLGTIVNRSVSNKVDQLFPQKLFKKANCNFSAHWFCSANGQAYSQAYY